MTMPAPDEVVYYVGGIADMARGERRGLSRFDLSTRGFWRSFWAVFYALPAYAYFWLFDRSLYLAENPNAEAGIGYIARAALGDAVALVLSLAVVAALARPLNMTNRFAQWVIAANWLSLPVSYATAAAVMLASALGGTNDLVFLVMMLLLAAVLFVSFRVYRIALNDDGMLAIGLIVITHAVALLTVQLIG